MTLWTSRPDVPAFEVPHPSSRDPRRLVDEWRQAVDDPSDHRHQRPECDGLRQLRHRVQGGRLHAHPAA